MSKHYLMRNTVSCLLTASMIVTVPCTAFASDNGSESQRIGQTSSEAELLAEAAAAENVTHDQLAAAKAALDSANAAATDADEALATAQSAAESAQQTYESALAESQSADKAYTSADASYDEAVSAYNAAKADYDANYQDAAKLKEAYDAASAEYTTAKSAYETAKANYNATKNTTYTKQSHNSDEFFKDMGSNMAYAYVTGKNIDGSALSYGRAESVLAAIDLDSDTDATSIDNMIYAIAMIDRYNQLRTDAGLSAVGVSDYNMALEQGNVDWSDTAVAHSSGCGNENLAWGYMDPSYGWYYQEKETFDKEYMRITGSSTGCPPAEAYNWYWNNYSQCSFGGVVGHYTNFVNPSWTTMGMAYDTNGSYGNCWGQNFSRSLSSSYGTVYTASEYRSRFINWLTNKYIADGMTSANATTTVVGLFAKADAYAAYGKASTDYGIAASSMYAAQEAYTQVESSNAALTAALSDAESAKDKAETAKSAAEKEKQSKATALQQATANKSAADSALSQATTKAESANASVKTAQSAYDGLYAQHLAEGHVSESRNYVAATCTEDGSTGGSICSVCGITLEEGKVIPALGHDWSEWVTTKEATYGEDGEQVRTCKNDSTHVETRVVSAKTFPDVSAGEWYTESVNRAASLGLITGYDDGRFGPSDTLTRAQAATILWRYYTGGTDTETADTTGMSDISAGGKWYTAAANWAVSNGVISGKDGGTRFDPNGKITREQLCAIVANASATYAGSTVEGADRAGLLSKSDASEVSSWAVDSVAWALDEGVITGKSGGTRVDPQGQVTRAEMAAILMNSIDHGLLG